MDIGALTRNTGEIENSGKYEYWLANVRMLSNRKKRELQMWAKGAKTLYYMEEIQLKTCSFLTGKDVEILTFSKKSWQIDREYEKLRKKRITFLSCNSPKYPSKLLEISSPPYALYIKGRLPDETRPSIAIVGARMCSSYGREMARIYSETLADAGVQIISGMAKGIDGIAQRAALDTEGMSFGVLGCGADICYPREHIELYHRLEQQGGILSEQPVGEPPLPQYFPARNRMISGISDAVIIIEAKEKSGSLITADQALEQGKDIYALPGPVNSALSRGCNMLIRQGAGILLSPEDLIKELHIICENKMKNLEPEKIVLETNEKLVYSCLGFYPKDLDRIAEETTLPVREILNVLISLELKGYIEEVSRNYYRVKRS